MSNHDWIGPPRHKPEDGDRHPDWEALMGELLDSGLTPDDIRARIKPVGAVLTYRLESIRRPHGPQRDDYACVIHGDHDQAERWARDRIRAVIQTEHRLSAITVVTSDQEDPQLEIINLEDTP